MPPVSDKAKAAVAAERRNIFCPPNGPGARDGGGGARGGPGGIFAATARPLPRNRLGAARRRRSVRRGACASIRVRASRGVRLVAAVFALSLAAALVPRGDQAPPSRSGDELRRAP